MERLESQEKRGRRLLGHSVAVPEPGQRPRRDRGKSVGLTPDVDDLFERGPPTRVQEQMSQEEVGQIVYLPVQLMTVGGRRPIPRYVDTRAQDEHIDWSAQSEDAGRELADRRQRRKIDGVMLPLVRNRAARA